jgi:hypothetical protein
LARGYRGCFFVGDADANLPEEMFGHGLPVKSASFSSGTLATASGDALLCMAFSFTMALPWHDHDDHAHGISRRILMPKSPLSSRLPSHPGFCVSLIWTLVVRRVSGGFWRFLAALPSSGGMQSFGVVDVSYHN